MLLEKKPLLLSVESNILDYVLYKLDGTIKDMTNYALSQYKSKFNEVDNFEDRWIRLHVKRDMINSFERWTKPTDILKEFHIEGEAWNVLTISTVISRNNVNHRLSMNIIWSGFNHNTSMFNYFAKSTLNQTFGTTHLDNYNSTINHLVRKRKLENEIYFCELNINRIRCNILISESKTDQDILNSQKKIWKDILSYSWDQAIKSGFDVSYEDEKEFNMVKAIAPKKAIDCYKLYKIERPKRKIFYLEEELSQLKEKYKKLYSK